MHQEFGTKLSYTKPLKTKIQPDERGGSPVIDKNGYLVGIVSGKEGNMIVICGTPYLAEMFDKYKIEYKNSSS